MFRKYPSIKDLNVVMCNASWGRTAALKYKEALQIVKISTIATCKHAKESLTIGQDQNLFGKAIRTLKLRETVWHIGAWAGILGAEEGEGLGYV